MCVCVCVCACARAHAREQLKKQVLTVQYMASLNKIVANILGYDGSVEAPFPKADRNALADLFQRCSVVQHSVFKDNEWTLGPRREPCGANTTLEMVDKKGAMSATIVFEWYWRNDEDEVSSPARCCSGRHSVRRRTPGRVHTHTHAHARTHTQAQVGGKAARGTQKLQSAACCNAVGHPRRVARASALDTSEERDASEERDTSARPPRVVCVSARRRVRDSRARPRRHGGRRGKQARGGRHRRRVLGASTCGGGWPRRAQGACSSAASAMSYSSIGRRRQRVARRGFGEAGWQCPRRARRGKRHGLPHGRLVRLDARQRGGARVRGRCRLAPARRGAPATRVFYAGSEGGSWRTTGTARRPTRRRRRRRRRESARAPEL